MNGHTILEKVNAENFEEIALQTFEFVYENNQLYRNFCERLKKRPGQIKNCEELPFLPIEFFKTHRILSTEDDVKLIFESSGTTDNKATSKHYLTDKYLYDKALLKTFELFFGPTENYCILALLPSYLERSNSSLVYMVNELMQKSLHSSNGFYLDNFDNLIAVLSDLKKKRQPTILFGVSFALLDLAERKALEFPELRIIETGGMKGRRKELIREELHEILKDGLGQAAIYSEYGMTELLSQCYAGPDAVFTCPPWMKVYIRDIHDPQSIKMQGKAGGINVIDLLNINSCPFIATQDLGRRTKKGFEVLGRFDNSDMRGCNLMWG